MMSVVKQQEIGATGFSVRCDPRDQLWLVPLMHQHQIRAVEHPVEVDPSVVVDHERYWRIGLAPSVERGWPVIPRQIRSAPAVAPLQSQHIETAMPAFA